MSRLSRVRPKLDSLDARAVPATFSVSNTLASGPGSFRQAVLDANAAPGKDAVTFDPAVVGKTINIGSDSLYPDSDGPIRITDDVSIIGPGSNAGVLGTVARQTVTIDTGLKWIDPSGRINNGTPFRAVQENTGRNLLLAPGGTHFVVDDGDPGRVVNVSISGLQLTGGYDARFYSDAARQSDPFALLFSSVRNAESLTLTDVDFHRNWSERGQPLVLNSGILSVVKSRFDDNQADTTSAIGALISNTGTLAVDGSELEGNTFTAAIAVPAGAAGSQVTVRNSTLVLDRGFGGGGIIAQGGKLAVVNSVIANGDGGSPSVRLYSGGISAFNTAVQLVNSTIYGNIVGRQAQDVIAQFGDPTDIPLLGHGLAMQGGTLEISNTVIARVPSVDPADLSNNPGTVPDVRLTNTNVLKNTNNFVQDGSLTGSLSGDPQLESLGYVLGYTYPRAFPEFVAPKPGSPLLDAGSLAAAVDPITGLPIATDIRGVTRRSGASVDIGAVEVIESPVADVQFSIAPATAPNADGSYTARLLVVNNGPDTATGLSIVVPIPPGSQFVSVGALPPGWTVTTPAAGSNGSLTFDIPSLVDQESWSVPITVRSAPPASSAQPIIAVAVFPQAAPDPSGNYAASVVVSNTGNGDATSVPVSVPLPAGAAFVTVTTPSGWTVTTPAFGQNGTVSIVIPSIPAGTSAAFTITVNDPTRTPFPTVTPPVLPSVVPLPADVVTTVTPSQTPNADGHFVATVTITNNGPGNAFNPVSHVTLPAGAILVSIQPPDGWTVNVLAGGRVIELTTPNLLNGESVTFTVVVAGPAGSTTPTAQVSSATFDPNSRNNTSNGGTTAGTPQVLVGGVSSGTPTPTGADPFATASVRAVPVPLAVGAGVGGGPRVMVFNPDGSVRFNFFAFGEDFRGGVTVAVGDVNGDGVPDIVAGAGIGGGPRVRVFDGRDLSVIYDFLAFEDDFRGGITVAAGDLNGDGFAEIAVGAGPDGGARVSVFDGRTLDRLANFFAFEASFRGGVAVAVGDSDGDGVNELWTAAGPGGGPRVSRFGLDGAELESFMAYSADFRGGAWVSAGSGLLVTAPGTTGGPDVRVFSGPDRAESDRFFAYDAGFSGGVRTAVVDVDGNGLPDVVTGAAIGGRSELAAFDLNPFAPLEDVFEFEAAFQNGVFVG